MLSLYLIFLLFRSASFPYHSLRCTSSSSFSFSSVHPPAPSSFPLPSSVLPPLCDHNLSTSHILVRHRLDWNSCVPPGNELMKEIWCGFRIINEHLDRICMDEMRTWLASFHTSLHFSYSLFIFFFLPFLLLSSLTFFFASCLFFSIGLSLYSLIIYFFLLYHPFLPPHSSSWFFSYNFILPFSLFLSPFLSLLFSSNQIFILFYVAFLVNKWKYFDGKTKQKAKHRWHSVFGCLWCQVVAVDVLTNGKQRHRWVMSMIGGRCDANWPVIGLDR